MSVMPFVEMARQHCSASMSPCPGVIPLRTPLNAVSLRALVFGDLFSNNACMTSSCPASSSMSYHLAATKQVLLCYSLSDCSMANSSIGKEARYA